MRTENQKVELIKRLSLAPGLPGFEGGISRIFAEELAITGAQMETDRIGNTLCTLPGSTNLEGSLKILIAAHMDEIGFMVSEILPDGFLRLQNLGGWNPVTIPSSPVEIITVEGQKVPGIIGNISPHFLKDRKSGVPEIPELFVDTGAKDAEAIQLGQGIRIGDPVVPVTNWDYNPATRCIMSKAFDDRIGVAALVELGLRLDRQNELPNRVCLAATVQEEVGTRGASVLAGYTDADIAIIVEGAPADDVPGGPSQPQTKVRGGAHVRIFDPTMIGHRGLLEFVREFAQPSGILTQETVRRGGGTDGMKLHLAGRGIPSIVTGVPVRYAHSHNCLVSLDDFDQLVDLLEMICMEVDSSIF